MKDTYRERERESLWYGKETKNHYIYIKLEMAKPVGESHNHWNSSSIY